jgi:hypothetical protein
MAGSIPNVSRDSFDFSKAYEKISLQQGVPIMDSDWNEAMDNTWIRGIHLLNHVFIGNSRFPVVEPDGTETADSGFLVYESSVNNTNNFLITAGYACCYGAVVGSTQAMPPADVEYEDQVMFEGTISSVAGLNIVDNDKVFSADHDLVGCRVKLTSGAASGTYKNITALASATSLTLNNVTSVSPGDTYEIYPEVLTTPAAGDRSDDVYLMVYFEDINENEDSAVAHPGTGIESVHKTKIRGVVRVAEGSTYTNLTADGTLANYGVRTMKIATLDRLNGNATITTAMIEEEPNTKSSVADLTASDIPFDDSVYSVRGYTAPSAGYNMQAVIDQILTDLADDSDPAIGSGLIGYYGASDSPDSLASGNVNNAFLDLLSLVNDRVKTIHPTAAPAAPVLVWRSHAVTLDANVTKDTSSLYIIPSMTGITNGGDALAFCHGCYLDGTSAYRSNDAPSSASMFVMSGSGFTQFVRTSPPVSWTWGTASQWDSEVGFDNTAGVFALGETDIYLQANGADQKIRFYPDTTGVDIDGEAHIEVYGMPVMVSPLKFLAVEDGQYIPSIYYDSDGLWIVINAVWDDGSYKWIGQDASNDAHAIKVTVNGIYFFHQSQHFTSFAVTGWSRDGWATAHRLGHSTGGAGLADPEDFYSGFTSYGNVFEKVSWQAGAKLQFASLAENLTPTFYTAYNFKTRWITAPANYSVALANNSANWSSVNVNNVDQDGFTMNVVFGAVTTNSGTPSYANGYVVFYN